MNTMAANDHHTAEAGIATGTAASTVGPEQVRSPRLVASPQPRLRPLLARGYAGFTEATAPPAAGPARDRLGPAGGQAGRLTPSPTRLRAGRPRRLRGPGGHLRPLVPGGDPEPLGAYTVLGLPLDELAGHTVDLTGMTPTQFQARLRSGREVKSVQDPVAASV